eukprot:m.49799 g.49799  ORF g.49799 m.49799 type:complete len:382 (-) comp7165_c0_seq1:61-1206(-)
MGLELEQAVRHARETGVLELRGKSALDATRKGYSLSHDDIVGVLDTLPPEVHRLDLSSSATVDATCERIATLLTTNTTLTDLTLASLDVTHAGVQSIAEALLTNRSLKSLSFRGCKVGSGPGVQALASALQTNTVLEVLDVGEMDLDISALTQFRIALGTNTTLKGICLDRPVRHPNMRPMLDAGPEDIAGHMSDLLRQNSTLQRLSLRKCEFTDEAMTVLAGGLGENRGLRHLDLGCNKIGRDGADALATALSTHPALEVLVMDANRIQDEGIVALCTALREAPSPTLRLLDVSHNGALGMVGHKTGHLYASGVSFLAETAQMVPTLKEIRMWGNPSVAAVGQLDHDAAAVVAQVLSDHPDIVSDVRPYEVDGKWCLAQV